MLARCAGCPTQRKRGWKKKPPDGAAFFQDNNRTGWSRKSAGPAGGFTYKRKQNKKGEEVGGIVPHITLKSIANNEPPAEEVLVDRPEVQNGITRVTGPFCVEATIPTPVDWEGDGIEEQTKFTLENIVDVLARAGCSLQDVVKVTVFLTDMSLWPKMNEIYAGFFPNDPPARSALGVKGLALPELLLGK